ncbi:nitronate monooxygenase [Chelativorans sp. ZYF759]|uniref:NAD(P)H-dependent flavin oxidoreductase n=1 Tax=Chelativorans sp. ZYF759 TaxID=2692213 RepID=UPI00145EDB02|nr:nitronate monooxygenase [Chelativorans sp. ZYF759]NMG41721.1 nitronate monooxygenase [Chelativorans sp. ZYF759]
MRPKLVPSARTGETVLSQEGSSREAQLTPSPTDRAADFCDRYGLQRPILMAPMAGACPPALAAATANAGGMGACGALLFEPDQIKDWAESFRARSNGAFQMNLWIPDPPPLRDAAGEAAVRRFLSGWEAEPAPGAEDQPMPDFEAQCRAMIASRPQVVSSIMGLYPPAFVVEMKRAGIAWFATATTVGEAIEAEAAGADAIIAQGMEAGGHRGAFAAGDAETNLVGSMALIPAVADAVDLPVIAAGGIADGRAVAAALILGASAVMIGTALLRSPEAEIAPAWADALSKARPEHTLATRAFSGRLGRSLRTAFAEAWRDEGAPTPAPYPIQRNLTGALRSRGLRENDIDRIQAWAGQAASRAPCRPAGEIVIELWDEAKRLLPAAG